MSERMAEPFDEVPTMNWIRSRGTYKTEYRFTVSDNVIEEVKAVYWKT